MGLHALILLSRFTLPALALLCAVWLLLVARAQPAQSAPKTDRVVSNCADDIELRQALFDIQNGGGGTLTFVCGTAAIALSGGVLPNVDTNTVVDGGGLITLSGANVTRIFTTGAGGTLTLRNLTLTLGNAPGAGSAGDGGCIWNFGTLVLDHALIQNCSANRDGGGIYNYTGGNISIGHSTVRNNTAQHDCGGICDYGHSVDMSDSTLSGNRALTNNAGGLGSVGVVTLTNSLVVSNSAGLDGGGLYNNVSMRLSQVTLRENIANICGGGIFNGAGVLTISASRFTANQVLGGFPCNGSVGLVGGGGAIATWSTVDVSDSTFEHNSVFPHGGALFAEAANVSLNRVTFARNYARNKGGAGVVAGGRFTVTNSTFAENLAGGPGGGLEVEGLAVALLVHVTMSGNAASFGNTGGGIHNFGATVRLKNTIIARSPEGGNCSGSMLSDGYNISSDTSCGLSHFSDRNDTNPYLGALTNNGGSLLTQMIFPPSTAINNGQCVVGIPTDQRGVPRLVGLSCDIGAVEYQPGVPMPFLWLPVVRR